MALEAKPSTKQTKNPLTKPISKFVGNLFGTCDRQWQDLPAITLLCDFANPCEKFPPPSPPYSLPNRGLHIYGRKRTNLLKISIRRT